jgi:hypothetical protein
MFRQLLTLLAVFTGLTTAVAPAQAMHMGVSAVVAAQDVASGQVQVAAVVQEQAQALSRTPAPLAQAAPHTVQLSITPAVIIRVDRAHE